MERAAPMAHRAGGGPARDELGARRAIRKTTTFSIARWDGLAWLCATATSAASIPSPVSQPPSTRRPVGFHQHANAGGCSGAPRVGLQLERQLRAIVARRAGLHGRGIHREGNGRTRCSANAPSVSCSRSTGWRTRLTRIAAFRLKVDPELNQLFQDVKTLDAFDAAAFAAHLQAFREALG